VIRLRTIGLTLLIAIAGIVAGPAATAAASRPAAKRSLAATSGRRHARRHRHSRHGKKSKAEARLKPAKSATKRVTGRGLPGDDKRVCVYSSDHISLLELFDELVGRNINCVMVFNDASPDWSGWENPWFLHDSLSDMNWSAWATAPGTNRQLIITQNLFPASEDNADWLQQGAAGDFESYAKTLATNLVNAGLGNSVIRLAHEANGNWYPDSIPDTTTGDQEWIQFWRNTVIAMRSVPGANFKFDWCVNAGYRNIPLTDFYPGNDVVDIIGIDAYDSADPSQSNRWPTLDNQQMGVAQVEAFAAAHDKPLSFPEWGVEPAINPNDNGGGDDPGYVQGLANVVANDDVAYQSYFFSGESLMQLENSPKSIAAYRAAFGATGYAVPTSAQTPQTLTTPNIPTLQITSGPPFASTINTTTTTFTFTPQPGYTPVCSLDNQPWRACTTNTSDTLTNLTPGYHRWSVQISDTNEVVHLIDRDFRVG
jgi:hypothetical protein